MAKLFREGWKKYGYVGVEIEAIAFDFALTTIMASVWNISNISGTIELTTGPFPNSVALTVDYPTVTNVDINLRHTIGSNEPSLVSGFYFRCRDFPTSSMSLFAYLDGTTRQVSINLTDTGYLVISNGSVLGTSVQQLVLNTWYYIEFASVITSAGTGSAVLRVNGVDWLNLSNVDTAGGTTNNYANAIRLGGTGSVYIFDFGELYLNSGTTMLGEQRVETVLVNANDSVQFTPGAVVFGDSQEGENQVNVAANVINLRKYVAPMNGDLASVGFLTKGTNASAKYTGMLYADVGGVPSGPPLGTTTELTGVTANVRAVLPFITPPTLVAGTSYWIGIISNTLVAFALSDTLFSGLTKSATYGSGVPNPAPTGMAAQYSYCIYGNMTPAAGDNAAAVKSRPPAGDLSYNASSVVGDIDLFTNTGLSEVPLSIEDVTVYGYVRKTDVSARGVNLKVKSNATVANGSASNIPINVSYGWVDSRFDVDPDTGAAWGAGGVNAAKIGYENAS